MPEITEEIQYKRGSDKILYKFTVLRILVEKSKLGDIPATLIARLAPIMYL